MGDVSQSATRMRSRIPPVLLGETFCNGSHASITLNAIFEKKYILA
jgi:hypothetical protein